MAFDNFLHKLISFELAKPESPERPADRIPYPTERNQTFSNSMIENSNYGSSNGLLNPITSMEKSFRPPDQNFYEDNYSPEEPKTNFQGHEIPVQVSLIN